MGPTWVLSAPDGPHVGPMNLAIRECKLIINEILWHSLQGYVSLNTQDINLEVVLKICTFEIIATYVRQNWVDVCISLKTRFMGPTWGPSGANRTQVGPMLATWTLLSGLILRDESAFVEVMGCRWTATSHNLLWKWLILIPVIPFHNIQFQEH